MFGQFHDSEDSEDFNVVDSFDTISGFLGCKCCAKVNIKRAVGRFVTAQRRREEESNFSAKCYLIKTNSPSRLPYVVHMFPSNLKFSLDTIYTSTFDSKNRSIELTFQEGRSALKLQFHFYHDFFLFQKYIELREEDGDNDNLIYIKDAKISGATNSASGKSQKKNLRKRSRSRGGQPVPGQTKKPTKVFGSIALSAQEGMFSDRKCEEWRVADYRLWLKRLPIQIVFGNSSRNEEENDIVISNLYDVLKKYGIQSHLEKYLSHSSMIQFGEELLKLDKVRHVRNRSSSYYGLDEEEKEDKKEEEEEEEEEGEGEGEEEEEEEEEEEKKNKKKKNKKKKGDKKASQKNKNKKTPPICMSPQLEGFFQRHQVVRRHLIFHVDIAKDAGWIFNSDYYLVLDKVVRFLQKKKGFKNRQKLEEIETGLFYHRRSLWDPVRLRQRILLMLLYNTSVEKLIERYTKSFHQFELDFREKLEKEIHAQMSQQFEEERRINQMKKKEKKKPRKKQNNNNNNIEDGEIEQEGEEEDERDIIDDDDDDDDLHGLFQQNTPTAKYKFTPDDFDRMLHLFNVRERLRIDQLSYSVHLQAQRNEIWKKKIHLSRERRDSRNRLTNRIEMNKKLLKKIDELESQKKRILGQSSSSSSSSSSNTTTPSSSPTSSSDNETTAATSSSSSLYKTLLRRVGGQIQQREAEKEEGMEKEEKIRDEFENASNDLMEQKRLLRDCIPRKRAMGEYKFTSSPERLEQIERLIQNRLEFLQKQQEKQFELSSSSSLALHSSSSNRGSNTVKSSRNQIMSQYQRQEEEDEEEEETSNKSGKINNNNNDQKKKKKKNKTRFQNNFEFQVKLVLAKHAASPPQFIRELVKKFVDPFFSPKYLSFGFIHSYILIKNVQIHFFDNSLVYVNDFKNSPVNNYQNIVCLDTDFPMICDFDTLKKKIGSIADTIIRWNTEIEYATFRVWGMNDKRNCQEFVLEMLEVLDTPPFYPRVNKYLSSLRKRLEEGFHNEVDLRFITVEYEFEKEFRNVIRHCNSLEKKKSNNDENIDQESGKINQLEEEEEDDDDEVLVVEEEEEEEFDEKKSTKVFFKTHEQVDDFVHGCRKIDLDFDFNYPGIIKILKGFDRAFWMTKRQFNNKEKSSSTSRNGRSLRVDRRLEPSKNGCPFISKKRKRPNFN